MAKDANQQNNILGNRKSKVNNNFTNMNIL